MPDITWLQWHTISPTTNPGSVIRKIMSASYLGCFYALDDFYLTSSSWKSGHNIEMVISVQTNKSVLVFFLRQQGRSHATVCFGGVGGHSLPPFLGPHALFCSLVLVPFPQVAVQTLHSFQSPQVQSHLKFFTSSLSWNIFFSSLSRSISSLWAVSVRLPRVVSRSWADLLILDSFR